MHVLVSFSVLPHASQSQPLSSSVAPNVASMEHRHEQQQREQRPQAVVHPAHMSLASFQLAYARIEQVDALVQREPDSSATHRYHASLTALNRRQHMRAQPLGD